MSERRPEGVEGYSLDTGLFPFDIFEFDTPTLKVKSGYELLAMPPVGFVYIQFPTKESPETLWPSATWDNISDEFAGDFFRSEGGDASAFESGEQADQLQGHFHNVEYKPASGGGSSTTHNGTAVGLGAYTADAAHRAVAAITDGTNGTPRVGTTTRPVNRTIRIWERTA